MESSLSAGIRAVRTITAYEEDLIKRYGQFNEDLIALDDEIKKNGVMIDVVGGNEIYRKVNPAVTEKQKINTAMNNILKTLGLDAKSVLDYKAPETTGVNVDAYE
ncbi:P27 family phage terminase small subunit [Weissella ceti]|uniref:P27 family phage terminase small subunit n=1 Tax=Weissella ceti TaxID=759620 RepID=A0ABT3E4B6_9LACO|nr:P27 family phage terminase small subunit [Weissella ceti]MCW0953255.1 P27 family phage terminase small subunit [Weissella ceti]